MSSINTVHVLIMDPSSNEAEHLINLLRNFGYAVRATAIQSESSLEAALAEQSWDLFVAKPEIEDFTAFRALEIVQNFGRDIPFVLLTYDYEPETHLKALKSGMKDVLPAPQQELFCLVVEREVRNLENRRKRRTAEVALHETEKRNELLLDSSNEAIAYVHEGMHIYANSAYSELFGYEDTEELECMPMMDMIERNDHELFKQYIKDHADTDNGEEFHFKGVCSDGATFAAVMTVSPAQYEGEDCTQLLIRTAGNSLELEEKLKELQAKDILTGLYNRSSFVEKVTEAIAKEQGTAHSSVYYFRIDQYDEMKTKFGLSDIDDLMKEAAVVIRKVFGDDCLAGRIAEGAFAMFGNFDNPNHAKESAQKLCDSYTSHLFELQGHTVNVTISLGIAARQENSLSGDSILQNAYAACMRATTKGGNNVKIYNPAIDNSDSQVNVQALEQLQEAMENDRIHITYQPIVKLHGDPAAYYQIGIDIQDENNVSIPLEEVIPTAQKAGMAIKIERWMVSKSISSLAQHKAQGNDAKLFIPLSNASLLDEKFPHFILECVKRAQIPTANLIFQVSESVAANHLKRTITFSKALAKLKCKFAISSFGGSSDPKSILNHVSFHYATLKEDAVTCLLGDEEQNAKIHELIEIIHQSEMNSIISKVEDAQSLAVLWPLGVHYIQGTYLQEPGYTMEYDFSDGDF
jgi:multidomain signaling protein FimX